MRIADKMGYDQVKTNLTHNRKEMSSLQNQAASMKRVNKPSDDPVAATQILGSRTERTLNNQFARNLDFAKAFMETSEQSLGELTEILMRAKELVLSQANDASSSESTRQVAGKEFEQQIGQVIQLGNRKFGDRFVFGGFKTTTAPFTERGEYSGDGGLIKVEISKDSYLNINTPGSDVFLGKGHFIAKPNLNPDIQNPPSDGEPSVQMRDPAQEQTTDPTQEQSNGINVVAMLKGIETALKTNDKFALQQSIDDLDSSIEQIIVARADFGARLMNLDSLRNSLHKTNVDLKALESKLEDADVFEIFTDINKTENTLKASLSTTGKLIQPSLLDFLR